MRSIKVHEKIIKWAFWRWQQTLLTLTRDTYTHGDRVPGRRALWNDISSPPPRCPSFRLPRPLGRTVLNPKYKMIDSIPALSHHSHSFLGYFISSASSISPAINCTLFLYFMECRVTVISLSGSVHFLEALFEVCRPWCVIQLWP